MARGEVGKVGVAIDSVQDMEVLFDKIPLDKVSHLYDYQLSGGHPAGARLFSSGHRLFGIILYVKTVLCIFNNSQKQIRHAGPDEDLVNTIMGILFWRRVGPLNILGQKHHRHI
jgi:hypothetical protein